MIALYFIFPGLFYGSGVSWTGDRKTPADKFIDDVSHSGYNTWVKGDTDAKSYESMLIDACRNLWMSLIY
ncbi:hypothetical protein DGG96_12390 [Legionella qingyii]|uniref:Uncharacterized protein n=1 Tax=Legionella qingyii TaxID=2184757 RepID=A0A317U1L9_9GAMM|nr:hypothetical protein [Legionella qingyii]PWY55259.1 hypothetical protein DGG96_12390 [Legionella qingyii]RUR22819.1 hypothetical protein ELY20_08845 [Legionella qingyii]RUR23886.1 hypothetical protein ELY16_12875 [Legionella qingyii]